MFGLLKKKIGSFISSIVQKEERTPEEKPVPEAPSEPKAQAPKEDERKREEEAKKQELLAKEKEERLELERKEKELRELEAKRKEEEKRLQELVKLAKEEKLKEERAKEERRLEEKKKRELEARKTDELARREEARKAVEQVKREEARKADEFARREAERTADEQSKREEARKAEGIVKREEAKRAEALARSERLLSEEKLKREELARKEEETRKEIEARKDALLKLEKEREARGREEEERKLSVKLGLGSRLRSFISRDVEIKESDVSELLDGLNLALLESDVAFEVSEHIVGEMRSKLVGMRVPKGEVDGAVKSAVRSALLEVLSAKGIDLLKIISERQKPVKILLLGPNGAGKTTTMAKLSTLFMKAGYSCVFSASDTFRAAAIEQAERHGEKLGVKVIKHKYGADPTAVAFDSVNYAKAHGIDVVIIDSAGRQETNRNLLEEMKKIARVVNPDVKLFVGESIAGNALVSQVKSFSEAVGLDGVILTKLDCDAKGGTALSLSKATGVPILYFGVGQAYSDLVPFSAEFVVNQILG